MDCGATSDEALGVVWDYTNTEIMLENVGAMLWTDWMAFILCAALVSLSIVGGEVVCCSSFEIKSNSKLRRSLSPPGVFLSLLQN